ncbi:phage tail terminator family protein [Sporosarcina sp. CAU 1771]
MNNLKSLMIARIRNVFGELKVYDEPVQQGLVTPSFQMLLVDTTQNTGLNMVERTYTVNINYFPLSIDERRTECDGVLETFQTNFRMIGNKHHVHNIEGSMNDDVLVITFNIRALLKEVNTGDKMNTLGGVTIETKD